MKIIQCWIEHPVRSLDQTFTYLSREEVERGMRVEIPFGSRKLIGFVEDVEDSEETKEEIETRLGFKLKEIISVLDQETLITEELHDLALFMRDELITPVIGCFQAMLPSKIKPATNTQRKAVTERWVRVSEEEYELTPKQLQAWMMVSENGEMKYSELRKLFPSQAADLIKKGALISFVKQKEAADVVVHEIRSDLALSPLQKETFDTIVNSDDDVFLLHGVTGSGKTEVYLQLARKAIEEGRQVLILVPEIGLTPQMIERVSSRFGSDLAIYHSRLNDQEKYEQYRKVKDGKARIVVGTRSSVFLPFEDLGLIVMDEEHDTSYKQTNQPAYHCRDIAIWRGKYHHCKVILGSATPSLDSYARALKNVYHLVKMNERINQTKALVKVVSMKDELRKGNQRILSAELIEMIRDRLERKEQVILLLNRRGYHNALRCRDCGTSVTCPHCDLAMHWHQDVKRLKCHTCGYETRALVRCPACGSNSGYTTVGYGTQKLEAELYELFERVRILRMDADTTTRKHAHEELLTSFGEGKADLLIGTQMIAKGLDYPNVTLVGVINADDGLNRTDFRSCETTFDLLVQSAGRSGRGLQAGEVVFQVFEPDHYAVRSAVEQNYELFFKEEMRFRHAGQYPPYTYMCALTLSGMNEKRVRDTAERLKSEISGNFKTIGVTELLKIKDQYRFRIILKGKNLDEMKESLRRLVRNTKTDLNGLKIDINPISLE